MFEYLFLLLMSEVSSDQKVDQWKLITYPYDTRCPIILTAKLNLFCLFIKIENIQLTSKRQKQSLQNIKYFSLENLFVHIVVSVEQQEPDPMNPILSNYLFHPLRW